MHPDRKLHLEVRKILRDFEEGLQSYKDKCRMASFSLAECRIKELVKKYTNETQEKLNQED